MAEVAFDCSKTRLVEKPKVFFYNQKPAREGHEKVTKKTCKS